MYAKQYLGIVWLQPHPKVRFDYHLHLPNDTLDNVNIGYGLAVTRGGRSHVMPVPFILMSRLGILQKCFPRNFYHQGTPPSQIITIQVCFFLKFRLSWQICLIRLPKHCVCKWSPILVLALGLIALLQWSDHSPSLPSLLAVHHWGFFWGSYFPFVEKVKVHPSL